MATLADLYVSSGVLGVAVLLAFIALGTYINTRLKNISTKHDIKGIAEITEDVKGYVEHGYMIESERWHLRKDIFLEIMDLYAQQLHNFKRVKIGFEDCFDGDTYKITSELQEKIDDVSNKWKEIELKFPRARLILSTSITDEILKQLDLRIANHKEVEELTNKSKREKVELLLEKHVSSAEKVIDMLVSAGESELFHGKKTGKS